MKAYSYLRFSSPEQEKGDSVRRQVAAAEEWASEHGLVLDASLRMEDRGLSAFKGVHRIKGALGAFFRKVESGEVPKGSVLIVESLDRLSREQVLDALSQFTSLITAGIKVVTLADKMEYSEESINSNFGQLLMSLVVMSRAHEESQIKSQRLSAAWENKRNNLHKEKLSGNCPDWLRLKEDKSGFELVKENVAVVKRIFDMKIKGMGSGRIAKVLNEEKAPWIPRKKNWGGFNKMYIKRILRSGAVIGEFQPRKGLVPIGEPIPDYFPAIIGGWKWGHVQNKMKEHRGKGGRTGTVSNLFGFIAVCGYCKGPMRFVSKNKAKGEEYLVCDSARRGKGCHHVPLRYDPFEKLVLTHLKELRLADILPKEGAKQDRLSALLEERAGREGQLHLAEKGIENLLKALELHDGKDKSFQVLNNRLTALIEEKEKLRADLKSLADQIAAESAQEEETEKTIKNIRQLYNAMNRADPEKRINIRLALRDQLRRLVLKIHVYPVGKPFMTEKIANTCLKLYKKDHPKSKDLAVLKDALYARIGNRDCQEHRIQLNTNDLIDRFLDKDGRVMEVVSGNWPIKDEKLTWEDVEPSRWSDPTTDPIAELVTDALFLYIDAKRQAKKARKQ